MILTVNSSDIEYSSATPTDPANPTLLIGKQWSTYGSDGGKIYAYQGGAYVLDMAKPILVTSVLWKNVAVNLTDAPLNRCGVWSTLEAQAGQYIGFGRKINAPHTKTYWIGVGADNSMDVEVNGIMIKSFPREDIEDHYRSWHLFPVILNKGDNIIHIKGYNNVGPASIGAEIYDATISQIQTMTSVSELTAVTIFTTGDLIGGYVEEGNLGTGYTCPDGYSFLNDGGSLSCIIPLPATEKYRTNKFKYTGTFMSERIVSMNVDSPIIINFTPKDYVNFRNEIFSLDKIPPIKKTASAQSIGNAFSYDLSFFSYRNELINCNFKDVVIGDNTLHYTGMTAVAFTGDVRVLADRIQANLNGLYPTLWTVIVTEEATDEIKNISIADGTCWDALDQAQSSYGLNFTVIGRVITIGASGVLHTPIFEYGKGNGLYSLTRGDMSDDPIVTRLRCYGSKDNLPLKYKKGDDSILPDAQYIPSLMLPDYETTGIDYIDSSPENIAIYGIREGVFRDDTIKPSIKGMTGEMIRAAGGESFSNGRIDQILSTSLILTDEQPDFQFEIPDIGFDINDYLGDETAKIEMTSGRLGGVTLEVTKVEMSENGYMITANRNNDSGFYLPDQVTFLQAGDTFVITGIYMPDIYVKVAELQIKVLGEANLADRDHSRFAYSLGVDEIYMVGSAMKDTVLEGDKIPIRDTDIGFDGAVIIQQLNISYGESLPKYEMTLSDKPINSALDLVRRGLADSIAVTTSNMSDADKLARQIEIKQNQIINQITNNNITETTLNTFLSGQNDVGSGIIDGAILWKEGLTYSATDINYKILGDKYTSPKQLKTLEPADPLLPRIDTFYGDIYGNLNVATGIPAENPIGVLLSGTQLFFMDVRIEAGATVPSGLDVNRVYLENTPPDWKTGFVADSYVTVDFASTDSPATGSKRIKISTNTPSTIQSAPFHRVGDEYQGGIIFWTSLDGTRGLVSAKTDVAPQWWSRLTGAHEVGAGSEEMGSGAANTAAMMADPIARLGVAKACTEYNEGSWAWFAPCDTELYLMWINKDKIGNFKDEKYWSSTEHYANKAVAINFATGGKDIWNKNNEMNVRPIHAFDDSIIPVNIPVPAITLHATEISFTSPEPVSVKNGMLSFNMKNSLPWRDSSAIIITAISGSTPTGVTAMKAGYMLGYKSDDPTWQMVAIPMNKFTGESKTTIDKFRFSFKFEWPNLMDLGFDDIRYQHTNVVTVVALEKVHKTDYRFEELPDGVRTVFTTLLEYIAGTVELYINGQKATKDSQYFEENGKIRLVNILDENDSLMCNYYTYK